MIVEIDKGVVISNLNKTLDSLYDALSGEDIEQNQEAKQNIEVSISEYEDTRSKVTDDKELSIHDYTKIALSMEINSQLMQKRAEEYREAANGIHKYKESILSYITNLENIKNE